MARVVITGGAGFLGSHIADRLLDRGDEVIAIDNLSTGSVANIEHLFGRAGFTFAQHDVSNFVWVPGPVDRVMHLASPASPIDYLRMPIQTLKVGSLGTHNTLGLAKAKGARFFLSSTSEVYGDPQEHPQVETYWGHVNPIGPRGVYDEAKRFAEAISMAYHRYHGVDVRIARIFNTFGPRMRRSDGRVVSNFIIQALKGEPLTVQGEGTQTRSFCYCDDTVAGLIALLDSDVTTPVNVGLDGGDDHPGSCLHRDRAHRLVLGAGLRGAAGRRSGPAAARHHGRPGAAGVGTAAVDVRDGLQRTIDYFRGVIEASGG